MESPELNRFDRNSIPANEDNFRDSFPDGHLETNDVGSGYEMVIRIGSQTETLLLPGMDSTGARRLHEIAAKEIRKNPGASLATNSYIEHIKRVVETERKKIDGGVQ